MTFEYDENKSKTNKLKHNIDFPSWMVQSLDKEAKHLGVSRQAIIKMWLADKLRSLNPKVANI